MPDIARRLVWASLALAFTVVAGSLGFWMLGEGRWSLPDCCYMTVISATTVGFGETLEGMDQVHGARFWTSVVILMGVGTFGFAASMLTAFVVESDLQEAFRKKKMRKIIESLRDHMVVCGVGSTGRHVVREMVATRTPVIAIDSDEEKLRELADEFLPHALPYILGDATDDHVLEQAGVARARGIVAALPDDKDNLYIVVSARGMAPNARIISRGHDLRVAEKLRKAGANSVVSPNFIGGMRLASEMLRPHVVEFLDEMLRDRDRNLRIEEVAVAPACGVAGRTLRESQLRNVTEALVLAIRAKGGRGFTYNPGPDTVLESGSILVVLGTQEAVAKLRTFLGAA